MSLLKLPITDNTVEMPIWEDHKTRAKNYFAVMTGDNWVSRRMVFHRIRGKTVDLAKPRILQVGDALEIRAEYSTAAGHVDKKNRIYGVVQKVGPKELAIKVYDTDKEAWDNRKVAAKPKATSDAEIRALMTSVCDGMERLAKLGLLAVTVHRDEDMEKDPLPDPKDAYLGIAEVLEDDDGKPFVAMAVVLHEGEAA